MKYITGFFVLIWRIWMIFLAAIYVLTIGVFIVLPLASFEKTFPYIYPLIRYWGKFVLYGTGFRIDYKKLLPLDSKENYVFIANHTSIMDIMLMLTILKHHPIVFVGKAELLKIPIFGRIFERICIPVDRKSARSKALVYPEAKKKLDKNLSIFIFPEGGVTNDKEFKIYLDPFKDGAFNIAIETQTPLAVLAIHGVNKMFPFNWFRGYPGKIKVRLLETFKTRDLNVKNDKVALKEAAYNMILKDLEQ
ncbi:lysophospholipid acyltransferase family protein [Empedobacter falsenii]